MKKLIALLCLFSLLLPLCACSSELAADQRAETGTLTEEAKNETETEEPLPTGEIVYPEGFSVGYNRQSVAPEVFPVQTYTYFNHMGYSNHDPVQVTCTALCDGTTPFLMISLDIRGVDTGFVDYSAKLIEKAVGIPKEQVFINATHTHSAPDNSHLGAGNLKQWLQLYYKRMIRAVTLALHDLTPAEAYIGTSHTDGVTFVRRYLLENGTYKCNPSKEDKPIAHESEADNELRTLRFDREGDKKDVLMVNYQTHYHGTFATQVSADFVHPLRQKVEKELDVHFAYHNGASGNLNFQSALGERKYHTLEKAAYAIGDTVIDAVKNESKAELGTLQHEASYYQSRGKEVRLYAFTIGDVGFVSAPYEMFDTNGVQIREGSPCKMTFVCAYTNGHMGYCPSEEAFPHGAYEVEVSPFVRGNGEEFAQELIRLLHLCKERT